MFGNQTGSTYTAMMGLGALVAMAMDWALGPYAAWTFAVCSLLLGAIGHQLADDRSRSR